MRACWPRLIVFCIVFSGGSLGAEEYSHRVWRTEDGLPHNRVQAIAQTPEGYLWLGTSEGLARFDGMRFVTFDQSNTAAIQDNSILSLELAPDGSLWIGTEGGGLVHYSRGLFQAFGSAQGLSNAFVRAIHLDRSGELWVGTDRGFFHYTGGRFIRLDGTPEVPLASVVSIAEDAGGKLWIASAIGLLEYSGGKLRSSGCSRNPGSQRLLAVALVRAGLSSDGCSSPKVQIPDRAITSLHQDAFQNLWLGTAGEGLLSVNLRTGVTTSYTAPSDLPDNTILGLFEDRQHNIWAAAQAGLVRFSRAAVSTLGARDGLQDENVSSIYEDRKQDLWLSTFSGQIYRLEGDNPKRYLLPELYRGVRVRTVLEDRNHDYWFGSTGAGALRFSKGKVTQFTKKDGLRNDSIRQIFEDSEGFLWFATGSGISRWDGTRFSNYYLEEGLSYPSVRCIAQMANGDILVGTDAGLNRIHNGRIVSDPLLVNLKQEKIWSIRSNGEDLWLGTRGGGLILIRKGKITRFTSREGMISNSIYQILDDGAGRLWMSSPVGLFSVWLGGVDRFLAGSAASIPAVAYGASDGMATTQMSSGIQPAGYRRLSGVLWFATMRGAVKIDPQHIPEHKPEPVFIESITAGETGLPLAPEVTIPPGRGRVQIDFTSCDLSAPGQVRFRYKLEGFDDNWTSAVHQRSAVYSNLPAGHFRFRVLAEHPSAASPDLEASLAIYRKPEFHQTGWFYAMLALLLGCSLAAAMWIYARQTKARFALLLTERTRLAREMHDTVIQGCVGVSTLLEAIAGFLRSDTAEAGRLLTHARSEIKATLEEARQAVWDLRHSNGEHSSTLTLLNLARKLGQEHNVEVKTEIQGEQKPLDPETSRALLLVGREALRNSIAHADSESISVCIAFNGANVKMEIEDNGKGFDPQLAGLEQNGHFGIVGMRERVEQLGGTFAIHSRVGSGTRVAVSLPAVPFTARFAGPAQNSTMPR